MVADLQSLAAGSGPQCKSKRVTAQHTLERVRINQRRHRARQKDYIATLEQKLSLSEQSVMTLRDQVDTLRTQLAQYRGQDVQVGSSSTVLSRQLHSEEDRSWLAPPPSPGERGIQAVGLPVGNINLETLTLSAGLENSDHVAELEVSQAIVPPTQMSEPQHDGAIGALLPATATLYSIPMTIGTCCLDGISSEPCNDRTKEQAVFLNEESTMLCAEASLLIEQQNFKGISQDDVVTWLWNGFRQSFRPDEGCRVRTDLLFSLLAFISDA